MNTSGSSSARSRPRTRENGQAEPGSAYLLIDGDHVASRARATYSNVNPTTGEVSATVARADASDVEEAVGAARSAFEGPWRRFSPSERQRVLLRLADLLEEHAEELALLDSVDMGAPLHRTRNRVGAAADLLRWYAAQARVIQGQTLANSLPGGYFTYTLREPVGVIGAITPWNGPLTTAICKIGPVLATGCSVVLKPAEQSPMSALRIGELCLAAGVPAGVVNIVTGFGDAGSALASHPDVDGVSFTGSFATGQAIIRASASNAKRLALELGGKSPDIVFADADLGKAVPGAAMSIFANSGQMCLAGSRLFVERRIYEEFVDRLVQFAEALVVGDPLEPTTDLGPVVSAEHLDRILGYIQVGQEEGASVATGGSRLDGGAGHAGFFVPPTVFTDVVSGMRIAKEEIFGPVVVGVPFDDLEEAIAMANATDYGLSGYVWTRSLDKAHRVASDLRVGSVWVNSPPVNDPAVPFGGYKRSGYGREFGSRQLDDYLNDKSVLVSTY